MRHVFAHYSGSNDNPMKLVPSMSADFLGGAVNLISKSSFERSKPQLTIRGAVQFTGDDYSLSKAPGPGSIKARKLRPGCGPIRERSIPSTRRTQTTSSPRNPASFISQATNSEWIRQTIAAAYSQGELKLFKNRLSLLGGVRFEQTKNLGRGRLRDRDAIYRHAAAGNIVRNPNGTPVLITTNALEPARLAYKCHEHRFVRNDRCGPLAEKLAEGGDDPPGELGFVAGVPAPHHHQIMLG